MSENLSEKLEMSSIAEASDLIRRAAEPRPVGDSVKAAISRAARKLGLTFSRAKSIWYGEAHRIDANEMDALRKQAGIYEAVAFNLRVQDEDFHRAQIDALEHVARVLRNMGRTGDSQ